MDVRVETFGDWLGQVRYPDGSVAESTEKRGYNLRYRMNETDLQHLEIEVTQASREDPFRITIQKVADRIDRTDSPGHR